jgi:hypothetical protein
VAAISIAGALFLILDLDRPFSGLMQISSAPLQNVLAMNRKIANRRASENLLLARRTAYGSPRLQHYILPAC